MKKPTGRWPAGLLTSMLVGIGILTLTPQADSGYTSTGILCLMCGARGIADLVLNVGLFAPVGFALAAGGRRPVISLGISLSIAAAIELLQIAVPGREVNVRDVLANGVGGGMGAAVFFYGGTWVRSERRARICALITLVGVLGTIGAVGPLMEPLPPPTRVFVNWNPDQEHLERWTGAVTSVRVRNEPVLPGANVPAEPIEDALLRGAAIEIRAVAGRPPERISGIFTVNDAQTNEILLVGAEGNDLVVRFRRRAAAAHLASPSVVFDGALSGVEPNDTLLLQVERLSGPVCATVSGRKACAAQASAGSAWRLLIWTSRLSSQVSRVLDAGTLAICFCLLALFSAVLRPWQAVAILTLGVVGTASVAAWWGLRFVAMPELLGVSVGVLVGLALSRCFASAPTGLPERNRRDY